MKRIDLILLISVIALTIFGLLMIYDASSFVAFRDFEDKYHYIKGQASWALLGFMGLTFFSFFDYKRLYNLSLPILLGSIILLILVFIPGIGVRALGAHRWINLGFSTIQPAEFIKLSLSIYLASWLSHKEKGRLGAFLLLLGFIVFLVMLEPDMGTTIVILLQALSVYFLSGGKMLYLGLLAPVAGVIGYLLVRLSPYRLKRLESFFNLNSSFEETSYHVRQILIALGSGGIFGVGLGNSIQKYAYLPETTTDSIFAIVAEELGFVGASILILIFGLIIWRGFRIATKAKDNFGKLLAGGIISYLAIQTIINLAAQTALIPLTGIPLPFISYGGSALIVNLCSIGILLNISKQSS
ncbi:MAG: putative lipid II flippase FtsW [Patescibacteria group bacterium]